MIIAYRLEEISYLENSDYGDSTDTSYKNVVVEVRVFPSEEELEKYKKKYPQDRWYKA